jgi:anti-sigma factor (TIGR02949 family)
MTTRIDPNCAWVRDRIEELVEGELGDAERTQVARHANECPDCSREIGVSRRLRAELRSWPELALPPGVLERAAAEIARSESQRVAGHAPWRARSRGRCGARRAGVAAAVGAGVAIAAWFGWWRGPADTPNEPEPLADRVATDAVLRDLKVAFAYVDRYVVRALEESRLMGVRSRDDRS